MIGELTSLAETPQQQTLATSEPTRADSPVYTVDGLLGELRQGEVITHVAQYQYNPVSGRAAELYQEYVIVASQDCDLLWDYEAIQRGEGGDMNGLLLYEAEAALSVKSRMHHQKQQDIWKRVQGNREERYYYMEEVPSDLDLTAEGLPALVVDFKRYFTMPATELLRQCTLAHGARRRCRLEPPYREHFQSRTAFYLQRVGLPLSHRKPAEALTPPRAQDQAAADGRAG
jgi:hypothetical protein